MKPTRSRGGARGVDGLMNEGNDASVGGVNEKLLQDEYHSIAGSTLPTPFHLFVLVFPQCPFTLLHHRDGSLII